jgi:hypothetical protein
LLFYLYLTLNNDILFLALVLLKLEAADTAKGGGTKPKKYDSNNPTNVLTI